MAAVLFDSRGFPETCRNDALLANNFQERGKVGICVLNSFVSFWLILSHDSWGWPGSPSSACKSRLLVSRGAASSATGLIGRAHFL